LSSASRKPKASPFKIDEYYEPKILIISSDTGGGHRSAAVAKILIASTRRRASLQKFLRGKSVAVRVVKAVEESHHITEKLVGVYNWMLRNRQHWMKYLYWAMNRFRPETREFFHKALRRFRARNCLKNGVRTSSSAFIR
jgi:hypothetical protein